MIPETSCAQCRESLIWYVAGQLSPAEHAWIARHLADCVDCRAELAQWHKLAAVFTAADDLPADGDEETTWHHLLEHLPSSPHFTNNGRSTTRGFSAMKVDSPDTTITPVTPLASHASSAPRQRRTFLAPVAALLLIIIGVAVFTVLRPQHTTKVATSSTATGAPLAQGTPIDTSQPLPAGTTIDATTGLPQDMSLQKVQMVAANNGWAVGAIMPFSTTNTNTYQPPVSSLIVHYNGTAWQPVGVAIPDSQIFDIAMLPSGDGWAVGLTYTIPAGQQLPTATSLILHAVAGHWYRVIPPSSLYLTNVTSISAAEAWGIGATYSATAAEHTTVVIAHYTQGAWNIAGTFPSLSANAMTSLALASPSEGWAASGSQLIRLHNGTWTLWPTPLAGSINTIQTLAADNAWAVGINTSTGGSQPATNGFIAHFDGVTWKIVATPPENDITMLNSVAMTAPTNGWAVGNTEHEADLAPAVLLYYSGGAWSNVATPAAGTLNSIAMVSPTEGWIVGTNNHHSGGHATALIWHYHNGIWSVYSK